MPKIIKMPEGNPLAVFWLGGNSEIRVTLCLTNVEQRAAINGGWVADEQDAKSCGTTLAEIRAELGGGRVSGEVKGSPTLFDALSAIGTDAEAAKALVIELYLLFGLAINCGDHRRAVGFLRDRCDQILASAIETANTRKDVTG